MTKHLTHQQSPDDVPHAYDRQRESEPESGVPPKGATRRSPLVRVISESVTLVDLAAIVISAVVAEFLYAGLVLQETIDIQRTLGLSFIAGIITLGIFAYLHLYRSESVLRPRYATLQKAIVGWFLAIISLIVMAFLTKTSEEFSRGWVLLWAISTPAAILLGRVVVRHLAMWLIGQAGLARHVAIVGAGPVADRLSLHLCNRNPELVLVGIFDDRSPDRDNGTGTLAPIGTTQDLVNRGQREPLDEIIITVPMSARTRLDQLIETLAVLPIDIRMCPGMPLIEGTAPSVSYLDDMPLISALKRPIGEWAWVAKTTFDRIVATLLLVTASPLMLLIAIAIRLESKGPALFKQRRNGFNHEIITMLKFRSMVVMEDSNTVKQARRNDARITRLGAILRRTSLDELPQLINVIRGDMSLVGPRPHALTHNRHYATIIGHYANRHRVKPGMTGLAQVNGLRGETDTPEKMEARIKYDLYYIENWSLWLDIKILLRTMIVLPFQTSAY
ncbi:undecaprenyl-phosphate glucose phosphotransferase [Pyruvatibacter sp.]|uniref:undecaprenyl-phosphate glucose phosphotransferase n=1 Tax=Pyruvatibacter sp. TaxID=1981328 RepID=UPI0032EFCAAC